MLQIVTHPKKSLAIELVANGVEFNKVAEHIGVTRQTLYRWMQAKEFQIALRAISADRLKRLSSRLAMLDDLVLDGLESILRGHDNRLRLRAIEVHLNRRVELAGLADIEARVMALESGVMNGK